jgi:hypothetical protein
MPRIRPFLATGLLLAASCPSLRAGEADPPTMVRVTVSGRGWSLNGQDTVPSGLFGVHSMALTDTVVSEWGIESVRGINHNPAGYPTSISGVRSVTNRDGRVRSEGIPKQVQTYVECFYDRFQPALPLTNPDWKEFLVNVATNYGRRARQTGQTHYIEFWNEPYLNWACRPAVNYYGDYYETDEAKPGNPMRIKGYSSPVSNLVWSHEQFFAFMPRSRQVDFFRSSKIPSDGREGTTVNLQGHRGSVTLTNAAKANIYGECILLKKWVGKDLTQKHYWSGQVNVKFYVDMLTTFSKALKDANPDVQLAAGWGFNIFNEGWASWDQLYRPTLDAAWPWIDAVHEHHYGGDTRMVAASYEMTYAYALSRYNKRLNFWNTECGGHLDPEQPDQVQPHGGQSAAENARGGLTYMLRDVIHLLAFCPDKARIRAAHQPQDDGGSEQAFRLLKPLRGRLLEVQSDSALVWSAASLNSNLLCVVLFNDCSQETPVNLTVTSPIGTTFRSAALTRIEFPTHDAQAKPVLVESPHPTSNREFTVALSLKPKSAARLCLTLDQPPSRLPGIAEQQFATPVIRQTCSPDAPLRTQADLPESVLARATSARLRLAMEQGGTGELRCRINGIEHVLTVRVPWLADYPLPPDLLRERNEIEFVPQNPTKVCTASLILGTAHD